MMNKEGFEILIIAGHSEGKQNKRKKGATILTNSCKWMVEGLGRIVKKQK